MEFLQAGREVIEANILILLIISFVLYRLEILLEELRIRLRKKPLWFQLTLRLIEAMCAVSIGCIAFFVSWIGLTIVMPLRDPAISNMIVVGIFLGVIVTTLRQVQQLFELYIHGISSADPR